jgi:glycerol-3-phosphate acyltransferase PlsY
MLIALVGYLCGSIPFSFLLPLLKGIDIRRVGSGNVGGTNVLRELGGYWGAFSMLMDGLKSFIPIMIARYVFGITTGQAMMMGFFACLGHSYSVFLLFRGGKSVSSSVGTFTAVKGYFVAIFFAVWLPLVLITKYVSISSIIALYSLAVLGFLIVGLDFGLWALAIATLSAYRHRSNIMRLLNGTEKKTDLIGSFKKRLSGNTE